MNRKISKIFEKNPKHIKKKAIKELTGNDSSENFTELVKTTRGINKKLAKFLKKYEDFTVYRFNYDFKTRYLQPKKLISKVIVQKFNL